MRRARVPLAGLAILFAASAASAYQIGAASFIEDARSLNIHETMTAMAHECLRDAKGPPVDCSARLAKLPGRVTQRRPPRSTDDNYAVRWPDDPARMLDGDLSTLRFGAKFVNHCRSALAGGTEIDRAGLLCSSHFGRLQFLHAQATADDHGDAAATRTKILQWAMFAYRAATDEKFRATSYCAAIALPAHTALRTAMTPRDDAICKDRPRRILGLFRGHYHGWNVATLFSLTCPNPAQEAVCRQQTGPGGDALATAAARGALLHLIQDSFSQSHVARVPDGERTPGARGPFSARVVCRPPRLYYDYLAQNAPGPDDDGRVTKNPHAAADLPPTLDDSCAHADRLVDDPITASATVLYYFDHIDAAAFAHYLETRVFPG